jgi:sugar O-acyltransferase (sialic acid O-acetyltransferase NeuD family)
MLIIGAKGHAKEILDVLEKNGTKSDLFFYDDVSENIEIKLYGKYPIIRSVDELNDARFNKKIFALGVGNPHIRERMANKFKDLGWELTSIISNNIVLGNYNIALGRGINLMHNIFISNDVIIGEGTLINTGAMIHHDVRIGNYCEISPKVCLTGNITVGNKTFIGAGTNVIPKVKIGDNCIVGAGSVVTQDIPDNSLAVGVPAKVIRKITI